MLKRTATAEWTGSLQDGSGKMRMQSGWEGVYSVPSRFADGPGTNPEELIAAAHAGCYSMALTAALGRGGYDPVSVATTARVEVDKTGAGWTITRIHLQTEARVEGIEAEKFQNIAMDAKANCPVSRALAGPEITLEARLA